MSSQKRLNFLLRLQDLREGIVSIINRYNNKLQTSLDLFLEPFYKMIFLKQRCENAEKKEKCEIFNLEIRIE